MSTLQGRSLADTYKDLLQVSNSNIGVDGTIRYVEDGEGTASALSISTGKVGVGINDWTTNEVFNVQGDSLITGNLNVTGNILSNSATVITTNNELAALSNVSLAQPTDGQILKYSGTTNQWTPSDDIVTSYWSPAGVNDIYRFTGNVGIGTTNPLKPLHIAAEGHHIVIEDTNSSQETKYRGIYNNNQDLHMGRYDNSLGSFTSDVVINEIGNVGIGNTDPAVNLHIGTTTSESQWIRLGTQYGDFSIGNGSHNTPPVKYFSIYDNDAAQHRLFLLDSGDIGFGTTSPSARLHAYSFDSDSDLRLERGDNGQIVRIDQNSIRTMGATPLTIFTNSTGTNGLHIASDGDIGFSTVTPIHALELFGKGKRFALTSDHPDGTRINHVELASDGAGHGYTMIYNDVGNPMARIHSTGTSYFNGGNVGIGTANPEVDLHIKSTSAHGQSTLKLQGGLTGGYTSAIIFTNSDQTDNGAIYYNADDNFMRFNTGGLGLATEQMRITSSGDVGIGTDTPDNMLHVSGTGHTKVLTEGGSNNAVGFQMAQNLIDPGDGSVSPQIWQLQTQAGARNLQIRNATLNTIPLHIDGTAVKVGIGTTSPASTFTIASNSNTGSTLSNDPPFIAIENTRSDYTDDFVFGGLAFTKSGATYNQNGNFSSGIRAGLVVRYDGDSVSNTGSSNVGLKMDFHTAADGAGDGNVRMRIDSNGNIGIGTTEPGAKLDIRDSTDPVIALKNSNTNALAQIALVDQGSTAGAIAFKPRAANNSPETAMLVSSNGNVGIGTTNPDQCLQVASTTNVAARFNMIDGSFTNWLTIGCAAGSAATKFTSSTDGFHFDTGAAAGVNSLIIHQDGKVGIGVEYSEIASKTYKLHVNGTLKIYGTSYVDSSVITSDDRVKHNEQDIVGAIDTLSKITPKKYIKTSNLYNANHNFELDMNGNPVDEHGDPVECSVEAGVIAQQVLNIPELAFAVIPEDVDEDGNVTSPHSLNYNSLFTYAIAAIQEQQAMIDELKTQNQALINRIETLENK